MHITSRRLLARASRRAFTLLEILIVLALIGLLVGLGVTKFGKILDGGQVDAAKFFVQSTIKISLTAYRIHTGDYPSSSEGLEALITQPSNRSGWNGPYIDAVGGKAPVDPWKEPYVYRYPGTQNKGSYDLFSKGPDRTEGTPDDIKNW